MPENEEEISAPKKYLKWEAGEFAEYPKSAGWYMIFSFIGIIIAGVLFWQKNYTGMAVIIAVIIFFFTQAKIKPKVNKYIIDPTGLTINDKHFPFTKMKLFWSVATKDGNIVYIRTTNKLSAPLALQLGTINPKPIENFLKEFVPQDEKMGEITSDKISRLFRF